MVLLSEVATACSVGSCTCSRCEELIQYRGGWFLERVLVIEGRFGSYVSSPLHGSLG